jgi:hypothetical protein
LSLVLPRSAREPASRNCSGLDAAADATFFLRRADRLVASFRPSRGRPVTEPSPRKGVSAMGKGNHSQKNDKKNKKPKQDKTKTVVKK